MTLPGELRKLASIVKGEWCLNYDACPVAPGLVVNIDGYSERESRLPWMSLADWGWKAVIAAASDVAASGGKPLSIFYSVGVRSFRESFEVAEGVAAAADWIGVRVAKSDANRGGEAWIDVAVIGGTARAVPRSGAEPGDVVVQAGYVGPGAVAKEVLSSVIPLEEVPESVLAATRRPLPPVRLGPFIAGCSATAASDNSDGWGFTLSLIADASRVAIDLDTVLVDPGSAKVMEAHGIDPETGGLASWEDYSIAVTASEDSAECLLEACKRLSIPCSIVGRVERGRGVFLRGRQIEIGGWKSL